MHYLKNKLSRNFLVAAFTAISLLLSACGSGSNSTAPQVTADSAQLQRDDRGMSQQQHDGLEAPDADSTQNPDSTKPYATDSVQ